MNKLTVTEDIKNTVNLMQPEFKRALPPHISVEKFSRIVSTAVLKAPSHPSQDLTKADRKSLWEACTVCAQDGLLPDDREATFTVRKGKVVYMPMIAGILKKIRNSGELKSITAQVVYENDEYEYWVDENGEHFKHKRARGDRGDAILTYACAITKDGGVYFEEVDEEQMNAISSMALTDKIWKGPFRDEMKRKSAIRRLAKRLPMSTDLEEVIRRDDEIYEVQEAPAPLQSSEAPARLEQIIDVESNEEEAI